MWGKGEVGGKIAWMKWERVCLPKKEGELGVKNIKLFNITLLAKWRWCLFFNEDSLWGG